MSTSCRQPLCPRPSARSMQHPRTMDPPSGSPEYTQDSPLRVCATEAATPSTTTASPSSPTAGTKQREPVILELLEDIKPDDVLCQFSYAPATQTTVVTTTTTTTTKFPPLMMKAPQHLYELDPKVYPLASSPTPQSIKKLCFDLEGRPILFQEADDTLETLETVISSPA